MLMPIINDFDKKKSLITTRVSLFSCERTKLLEHTTHVMNVWILGLAVFPVVAKLIYGEPCVYPHNELNKFYEKFTSTIVINSTTPLAVCDVCVYKPTELLWRTMVVALRCSQMYPIRSAVSRYWSSHIKNVI